MERIYTKEEIMSGRKKLFMRMLAWLLLLTLTLGSVDISAISVFAAESVEGEDEVYQPEEEEIYVEADGVRLAGNVPCRVGTGGRL